MKRVDIEFFNIQSHAHTAFYFVGGANFIISPDNNVGKSTILLTISTMARLPYVSSDDLRDLLRDSDVRGSASFKYKVDSVEEIATMHLFGDRPTMTCFVEHIVNGVSTRLQKPPDSWYRAMGIKLTKVGEPLNIIDANSVQLFVDGNTASDVILSEVLIDSDVERIKENIGVLAKTAASDARDFESQLGQLDRVAGSLIYNPHVDEFDAEIENIECAATVLDWLEPLGDLTCLGSQESAAVNAMVDLEELQTGVQVISILSTVLEIGQHLGAYQEQDRLLDIFEEFLDESKHLQTAQQLLSEVGEFSLTSKEVRVLTEVNKALPAMEEALTVCSNLVTADFLASAIRTDAVELRTLEKDIDSARTTMANNFKIVKCPIRGEVYYGEECVPVNH